ncbi:MAG: asparagine synthase C-terminal domain-containing protein, partial [Pseudomonadota bacterium]
GLAFECSGRLPRPSAPTKHTNQYQRIGTTPHLVADVDVGLFLSAGIDSCALLGLMAEAGAQNIQTLTLAFKEFQGTTEDESPLARQAADAYGARHRVRVVDEAEFLDDLPAILNAMDQPSIDGVNTWFIAKAAREAGLKVALSGVGGDELLAGYPSFHSIPRWVGGLSLPGHIPGLGAAIRAILSRSHLRKTNPKLSGVVEYGGSYPGAYLLRRGLFMPWELDNVIDDPAFVADGSRRLSALKRGMHTDMAALKGSAMSRVAFLESTQYMRNQLLRDSDWAGMAHSLEIRTPLVDIELLRRLAGVTPTLQGPQGKQSLGAAPRPSLPKAITARAKTGFGVPTGRWLSKLVSTSDPAPVSKGEASRRWAQYVLNATPQHDTTSNNTTSQLAA